MLSVNTDQPMFANLLIVSFPRASLGSMFSDMKRTTIPLLMSGLKLWPFAHIITYGFIPLENRLLWVDLVEIVWGYHFVFRTRRQSH